eukprot:TRINITY_DN60217_c0_g1_i1.p1 TRINITY_DN60217_c0_g1~~TRINITY_DN60217_c0_g1_i1.p1  ORF type:complete len:483 (-),score=102.33 TRINITY_DN60217_c0_g1_i1:362-1810(-)
MAGYGGEPQPRDLPLAPAEICSAGRARGVSFGHDAELVDDLPPNWDLRQFQKRAKSLIDEYFISHAVEETTLAAQELIGACRSEADELGVLAIRGAVDRGKEAPNAMVKLLESLSKTTAVDGGALIRSFEKIFCTLTDIKMDAPHAESDILDILKGCIAGGAIDPALLTKLPESLLQAGLTRNKAEGNDEFREMLHKTAVELKTFKVASSRCLEEFFVALHPEEVGQQLQDLGMRPYQHEFVKKAITLSFSQPSETGRDQVVALLKHLHGAGVLSRDDVHWGVTRILGTLEDLALDNPQVANSCTDIFVDLLTEDLISVPFLRRCRQLRLGDSSGLKVLESVQRRTPEICKRNLGTAAFKKEVKAMILEYFNAGDLAEFGRCIRDMSPLEPKQGAELVRKIMVFAMERTGEECEKSLKLLVWIIRNEELDEKIIELGFDDMYANMADILLDVPDAQEMARTFVVQAKQMNILRESWAEPVVS